MYDLGVMENYEQIPEWYVEEMEAEIFNNWLESIGYFNTFENIA